MALQDFTYYANRAGDGGIGAEEINTPRAQAFLAELRKYDPYAYFRPTELGGSDASGQIGYTLDYDASKLPGIDGTGHLRDTPTGHGSGSSYLIPFETVDRPGEHWQENIIDPSKVQHSGLYGGVTTRDNINSPTTTLDWLGPLLVGGFGLAMGGMPFLYDGVFGQGAFGASAAGGGASVAGGAANIMDMPENYSWLMNDGVLTPAGGATIPSLDTSGDGYLGLDSGQAAAPITDLSTPARVGDVIRNGGVPGLDNIRQSLSELGVGGLSNTAAKLLKDSGLLAPSGGGAGGGGLLGGGGGGVGGKVDADNAAEILRRFYAAQAINPLLAARSQGRF